MNKNLALVALLVLIVSACANTNNPPDVPGQGAEKGGISLQNGDELKKFESRQEIIDYLDQTQSMGGNGIFYGRGMATDMVATGAPMAAVAESAQKGGDGDSGASSYSGTNVQVEGVDEADFVKNDGKYIYVISGQDLVIAEAYPAEDMEILSETRLKGYPREMFLKGDKLVVFFDGSEEVEGFMEYDIIPRPIYKQVTHAVVYDVSDREEPEVVADYDVKGGYITSRMIGDTVYLIAQDYVYHYGPMLDMPMVRESGKIAVMPPVYHFDTPSDSYNFNTVMSFNVNDKESVKAETFMMGYSNVIYVSEDNIYISYPKSQPWGFYNDYNKERFYKVVVPLLPSDVKQEIEDIRDNDDLDDQEKWDQISNIIQDLYNSMEKDEKEELISDIQKAVEEYEMEQELERRRTVIHRLSIEDGTIKYEAKAEVLGYLLNQFSMDENGDHFRVATTMESYINDKSAMYNNVYVLDMDMDVVGSLEKVAEDERIYSTRFMGDRLYMVTFQRVDPFFVIDLSNPEDPEVLGELKIPGFSDYLHPYDEDHIIGIGKDTKENEWGGISTNGVKVALFDVADVENPKLVDSYQIGEAGTESEALHDHKAFLFDKEKNLMVIPVREIKGKEVYDSRYGYYRQRVWQGAYAFTITDEAIDLKGKISHSEDEEEQYWWYGSPSAVRRSLFMDDVLYTVSQKKIQANSLDDMEEIESVELPYQLEQPVPYYR